MERDFILVVRAADSEQRWMPILIQYSKIIWLVFVMEDTVVYRLRIEDVQMRRLKKTVGEILVCEKLDLFEYVEW
jgi:hypothetical protein